MYKQVGNAVPCVLAEHIAKNIFDIIVEYKNREKNYE